MANPQWNENKNQGGSIWNHENGYKIESATETSMNSWLDSFLDPTGLVSGFWNDIIGATSQSREFSQQEYLQDKMNEYNTPLNQMMRMKEAGINPNTAASGIVQGGNESAQAPQVSSNTQGASAGLSALAGAAGAFGNLAQVGSVIRKNDAEAEDFLASAHRSNTLLPFDVQLSLENIGLTRANAQAVAIENFYRPQSLMLDIAQKRLTLPILRQQFNVLKSEYDKNMESVNLMKQQIIESKGRVDLFQYDKMVKLAEANEKNANATFMSGKAQILHDLHWDVSTGLTGLIAGRAIYQQDFDLEELDVNLARLQDGLFRINYGISQGAAEGSENVNKGLIKAEEEAKGRLQSQQGKIDIGKEGLKSALDVTGSHVRHHGFRAFGAGID